MVKAVPAAATGPGIYTATYSGIPVYEFQFGGDLKEHVMRRRGDNWINATHILKAAGFDKPARTRILEREVQKDVHEKIQGGYGKYQGTWIPLESGEALAHRNSIYDRLRPIFEFVPGDQSPPPAPRHTSKPKQPKKPAVPKFNSKAAPTPQPIPHPVATPQDVYDGGDVAMGEDDTPDNLTVASASYMAEDDGQDLSHFSTGHRKRKREDLQDMTEQQHSMYGDELLDYFLLSRNEQPAIRPEPPVNFQPDWVIDVDRHTALHWAAAMGDLEIIKQLKRSHARQNVQNSRGETPLMRAVNFTNCYEKQTFPAVLKELFDTVDQRDRTGCTVIHHAAVMKSGRVTSPSCARYYLDNILNKLQDTHEPNFVQQLIDMQDEDGNTAIHLAAKRGASKCIRALLGRGASTDIANNEGVRAEDLIKELNAGKKARVVTQRSSSPFAPDSQRHTSFRDAVLDGAGAGAGTGKGAVLMSGLPTSASAHHGRLAASYKSEAASTVHNRITPLVFEKFQDLARSYEDEWAEKDEVEREAGRLLANAQAELAALRRQVAQVEALLQPDELAGRLDADVGSIAQRVLGLVSHQNRIAVEGMVDRELGAAQAAVLNGDAGVDGGEHGAGGGSGSGNGSGSGSNGIDSSNGGGGGGDGEDDGNSVEERLRLANELRLLLSEQQTAESEYVAALSVVGTGENIDKYRRLLKSCLGPEADSLDDNLDGIISMMEEEAADHLVHSSGGGGGGGSGVNGSSAGGGGDPMEIAAL